MSAFEGTPSPLSADVINGSPLTSSVSLSVQSHFDLHHGLHLNLGGLVGHGGHDGRGLRGGAGATDEEVSKYMVVQLEG